MELNNQPRLRPRQKTKKKMKAKDITPGTLIQYADGATLRTNLQTLRAELEETSALFDRTPSLELLIKGEG